MWFRNKMLFAKSRNPSVIFCCVGEQFTTTTAAAVYDDTEASGSDVVVGGGSGGHSDGKASYFQVGLELKFG